MGATIGALNASISKRPSDRAILLCSCERQSSEFKWLRILKALSFYQIDRHRIATKSASSIAFPLMKVRLLETIEGQLAAASKKG